jgi:hypothetical protein
MKKHVATTVRPKSALAAIKPISPSNSKKKATGKVIVAVRCRPSIIGEEQKAPFTVHADKKAIQMDDGIGASLFGKLVFLN